MKYNDYPFEECCKAARLLVARGADVYQKFTCAGCGQRLTIDVPNKFHKKGTCDRCAVVTDIEKQGCNYLVHAMSGSKAAETILEGIVRP